MDQEQGGESLFIRGATVYTPENMIPNGEVVLRGGTIAALGPAGTLEPPPETTVIEASGLHTTPGFIDLQINGAFGHDFTSEPDSIWAVASQLSRFGVTSFLPTLISSPAAAVALAQEALAQCPADGFLGAFPLGLHPEGPFLNLEQAGAHDPQMPRPRMKSGLQGGRRRRECVW